MKKHIRSQGHYHCEYSHILHRGCVMYTNMGLCHKDADSVVGDAFHRLVCAFSNLSCKKKARTPAFFGGPVPDTRKNILLANQRRGLSQVGLLYAPSPRYHKF